MPPTAGGVPDLIQPMLAAPGSLPAGSGWAYEFKLDGVRAVTYLEAGLDREHAPMPGLEPRTGGLTGRWAAITRHRTGSADRARTRNVSCLKGRRLSHSSTAPCERNERALRAPGWNRTSATRRIEAVLSPSNLLS